MPSVARQNSIFAPVTALVFAAHQFDDLRAYLARRSEHTDTILISDVEQLLMSSDGRLAESGYRFNILGFQSLAGGVSRGLASLFSELAGQYYKPQSCDVEYSLPAAISVYNTSVRARIGALRERSLLVNHQERVVEGFLGLSHRRLDNSIFLDIVSNEIREKQPKAEFYRAELVGRELRIYYIDPATRRKDIYSDARHTIVAGWSFDNCEDRGKAINAGPCLFTRFGVALEKPAGSSRMNHVGADIVGRTGLLVGRAAAREIDMTAVLAQLAKLQLVPLEFVDDPEKFDQVALKWLIFLARVGIRRDDAKMIVRNAAMVGADCEARDPVDVYTRSVLGSRTAYDLLCSLLRYSKNAPITDRTALQQAAMRLILPQPSVRRQQRKKL
jgi:hypothetical protein